MRVLLVLTLLLAGCGSRTEEVLDQPGYIYVNGIRIHFERTGEGSGKPPMVLVHGITESGASWSLIVRELSSDYDVIYYDVRGHGLSDKPSSGYRLEDHEKDLIALIDELGLEKPVLMGHSMGGGIVAQTVADHPGLARAVILEDPAFFPQPEDLEDVLQLLNTFLLSFRNWTKEQLLERAASENPHWTEGEWDSWAESKLQFSPRIIETVRDLPDVGALLPRIQEPVLLLKADASPEERRKHIEAASGMREGRLIHIDGAGHTIHRDKPAETLAAIREFLGER